MAKLAERLTVDPEQCGGRPCIRGMRVRMTYVLDLLANGLTVAQALEELPDLELEDIQACLRFASQRLNHQVVVAWCGREAYTAPFEPWRCGGSSMPVKWQNSSRNAKKR